MLLKKNLTDSNIKKRDEFISLFLYGYFFEIQTINFTIALIKSVKVVVTYGSYINKNIAFNINIDSICSAVNISKYYFCRQFIKHTGMTVMKYILKTRVTLAKADLKKTNLSVSDISEKNSFSIVSYFSRAFKEEENCSSLQYRKINLLEIPN